MSARHGSRRIDRNFSTAPNGSACPTWRAAAWGRARRASGNRRRIRERITLVADEKGGAHIRFLDRRTNVVSRMYLDDQNLAWMSFSDFTQTPALIRRYGLSGEEVLRPQQ